MRAVLLLQRYLRELRKSPLAAVVGEEHCSNCVMPIILPMLSAASNGFELNVGVVPEL